MATQIASVAPTSTSVPRAPAPQTDPKVEAARILNETRIGTGDKAAHRVDFIEAALDKIADTDPALAAAVRAEVVKGLSTTDQAALSRSEPGLTRDAGGGQTVTFAANSSVTQEQWIEKARAGGYRDYAIFAQLAGANDNPAILKAMDDVQSGRITPSQFAAAGSAVDEKSWTDGVGDFLSRFSPAGLAMEAAQPAIASLARDAGLGNTEWGAKLQKVLDTPGSMRAFNGGLAAGMVEGAKDFVVSIATLAGKTVQFAGDNSLVGSVGDGLRSVVPDSVKGWLRDVGIGGAMNEALPSAKRGEASVDALGKMGRAVVDYFGSRTPAQVGSDIKNGISKIWDSVKADHAKAAAQGPEAEARWWGKLVGKVTFEVAATFVPVAGVAGKVSKGAKAADVATDLIRAGDKVGDAVRMGDRIGDAARVFSKFVRDTADRLGISPAKVQEIIDTPKALRPDPVSYIPAKRIAEHAQAFEGGASRFTLKSSLDKYGLGQRDGTTFVLPKREADQILAAAKGDPRKLEELLGLPKGQLDSAELVRIDFTPKAAKDLNLRMPSGREAGANEQWLPGGLLPSGANEAVLDGTKAASGQFKVTSVKP